MHGIVPAMSSTPHDVGPGRAGVGGDPRGGARILRGTRHAGRSGHRRRAGQAGGAVVGQRAQGRRSRHGSGAGAAAGGAAGGDRSRLAARVAVGWQRNSTGVAGAAGHGRRGWRRWCRAWRRAGSTCAWWLQRQRQHVVWEGLAEGQRERLAALGVTPLPAGAEDPCEGVEGRFCGVRAGVCGFWRGTGSVRAPRGPSAVPTSRFCRAGPRSNSVSNTKARQTKLHGPAPDAGRSRAGMGRAGLGRDVTGAPPATCTWPSPSRSTTLASQTGGDSGCSARRVL